MYKITELIKNFYENDNVGVNVIEDEELDILTIYYDCDNVKNVRCSIFVEKDDSPAVTVKLFGVCVIPEGKYVSVLKLINKFNSEYKWARFSINDDLELNIGATNYVTEENAAEIADNLCYFCTNAYDEEYPNIMKTIWKDDNFYISESDTL